MSRQHPNVWIEYGRQTPESRCRTRNASKSPGNCTVARAGGTREARQGRRPLVRVDDRRHADRRRRDDDVPPGRRRRVDHVMIDVGRARAAADTVVQDLLQVVPRRVQVQRARSAAPRI